MKGARRMAARTRSGLAVRCELKGAARVARGMGLACRAAGSCVGTRAIGPAKSARVRPTRTGAFGRAIDELSGARRASRGTGWRSDCRRRSAAARRNVAARRNHPQPWRIDGGQVVQRFAQRTESPGENWRRKSRHGEPGEARRFAKRRGLVFPTSRILPQPQTRDNPAWRRRRNPRASTLRWSTLCRRAASDSCGVVSPRARSVPFRAKRWLAPDDLPRRLARGSLPELPRVLCRASAVAAAA